MAPDISGTLHIAGVGVVGSHLAWLVARTGEWSKIEIWDPDRVESHNLANQWYTDSDLGERKAVALCRRLARHSNASLVAHPESLDEQKISGYLVLTVDTMKSRSAVTAGTLEETLTLLDVRVGRANRGGLAGLMLTYRPWDPASAAEYRASLFPDDEALDNVCGQRIELSFAVFSAALVALGLHQLRSGVRIPRRTVWQSSLVPSGYET